MIFKVTPTREKDKSTYVRISSAFSSVLKWIETQWFNTCKRRGLHTIYLDCADVGKSATPMPSCLSAFWNQCMYA